MNAHVQVEFVQRVSVRICLVHISVSAIMGISKPIWNRIVKVRLIRLQTLISYERSLLYVLYIFFGGSYLRNQMKDECIYTLLSINIYSSWPIKKGYWYRTRNFGFNGRNVHSNVKNTYRCFFPSSKNRQLHLYI